MKVIGLNGMLQSGKDTFANFAEEVLPNQVARISLAYPLKKFCVNYLGIPEKNCFGNDFEKNQWVGQWGQIFKNPEILSKYEKEKDDNISGREVLQVVGTDIFRDNLNPNIWIDIAQKRLEDRQFDKEVSGDVKVVFITDVRFPNEVEWIKSHKYTGIRLYRYVSRSKDVAAHKSESLFSEISDNNFDHIIDAKDNQSLSALKKHVIRILYSEELLDGIFE